MFVLGLLLYLAPAFFAVWCIVLLFRNRSEGWVYQAQRALGWVALWTVPAAVAPFVRAVAGSGGYGFDPVETTVVLPGNWYVAFGGKTVVTIFEENVKAWTGHRRDTMFDNAPVFLTLMLVQVLLLALLVTWRFRRGAELRDPVVLGVGIFVAVNALLSASWPWWGT